MVECFTLCNTACITCLWCSLLFSFCFPKLVHELKKTNSSEICIQRMKCQEKVSKILNRCKSRENDKNTSRSEESYSDRNRNKKYVKETKSLDQKYMKKLSKDRLNGMGEREKNTCKCRNCLGYENGCQYFVSPDPNDENHLKDASHGKYKIYAKLTRKVDNSREKILHLKYKYNDSRREFVKFISSNSSECTSKINQQQCNYCG